MEQTKLKKWVTYTVTEGVCALIHCISLIIFFVKVNIVTTKINNSFVQNI